MTAVFTILVALIVVTPMLTIVDGLFSEGIVLAIAAVAIILIALTLRAGEFRRLGLLVKPIVPFAAIPCIWMLIQLAPMPGGWLVHPAWISASTALGNPLTGAISVDIGATLLCLAEYFLALAVALIATAVALDRQRAEITFLLLTAVAVSIAAGLIGSELGYLHFADINLSAQRPQMLDIAVVGLILSSAITIRVYESQEMQGARNGKQGGSPSLAVVASIAAFAVCLSALLINADTVLLLAAACGVGIVLSVTAIRRQRLGPWGKSGMAAAALIGLIGFLAANPVNKESDLTLSLSGQPRILIATADRMLADVKWAGTGAGTFEALAPIYRDADDASSYAAPTAASAIAIEMGRPFLGGLMILTLLGAGMLFRHALLRGRDYLYAAAGAGCAAALLISSLANAGIFGLAAALLTSAVLGLALAQSRSWTSSDFATSNFRTTSAAHGTKPV